jgi:DNA-binding transcriptional MerR regulator
MKKRVLRTIDLAHRIGVQPEAIRYYERRGLLPTPRRAASGYRIYTPEHVERVDFIKQCQTLGFSLDEIRELMELKFRGNSPCQHVRECEKTLKRHRDDCCPVLERLEKPIAQEERTTS